MARLKLATVWLGGCSGCHMSFLDLDEWLIDLAATADIVFTPLADFKQYPDDVDAVLVEGAHTLDMAGRGGGSKVITDLNQPWGSSKTCTSCGKCFMACPTGAIFRQGSTVAEMERARSKLEFLVHARKDRQWIA